MRARMLALAGSSAALGRPAAAALPTVPAAIGAAELAAFFGGMWSLGGLQGKATTRELSDALALRLREKKKPHEKKEPQNSSSGAQMNSFAKSSRSTSDVAHCGRSRALALVRFGERATLRGLLGGAPSPCLGAPRTHREAPLARA